MSAKLLALAMETYITDPRLKLLLIALADSSNDAGVTEPRSADWLAKVIGRKRSSIFSYIKNAEKVGWLERLPQFENNCRASNRYQLRHEEWPIDAVDAVQHAGRRQIASTDDAVQHAGRGAVQHAGRLQNNIHELNLNELNSGEKFSTVSQKEISPKVAEFNRNQIAKFVPSAQLIEWAGHNCPLVPVATATAQWREWVLANMTTRLKNPTAHWRGFLKKQQAWLAEEQNSRAALYVGANETPARQLSLVPDAPDGEAPAAQIGGNVFELEVDPVDAALQAMSTAEVAELRAQVEQQLALRMGDKLKLWDEETKRSTINANVRRIVREQLLAREAA